jgi:hypothetical protein
MSSISIGIRSVSVAGSSSNWIQGDARPASPSELLSCPPFIKHAQEGEKGNDLPAVGVGVAQPLWSLAWRLQYPGSTPDTDRVCVFSTAFRLTPGPSQPPLQLVLCGAEHHSGGQRLCSQSVVSQHFMEPEGSFSHSQLLSTCTYPKPDQSSPQHAILSLKGPS